MREFYLERNYMHEPADEECSLFYRGVQRAINFGGKELRSTKWTTALEAARELYSWIQQAKWLNSDDNQYAYKLGEILKKYDFVKKEDDFDIFLLNEASMQKDQQPFQHLMIKEEEFKNDVCGKETGKK